MAGGKISTISTTWLNFYFRGGSFTAPTHLYVGLYTTTPLNDGTSGTEVSGGAYARQDLGVSGTTIWSAPSVGKITNSNPVTFPQATAGWGTVKSVGLFDALTTGNLTYVVPMVTGSFVDFENDDTTNGIFHCPAHGFTSGMAVRLFSAGATIPTGFTRDTIYYVTSTSLATNTFTLSATSGGSVVVPSAAGAGEVVQDSSFNVVQNATLSFAVGQIQITDSLPYTS